MKIVHLCLACFFPDHYSYQENMLPKFHKKLGHEVEVIASLATFDQDGKSVFMKKGNMYINEYGIKVTRLDNKKPLIFYRKLKRYIGVFEILEKANPDILFIHGCQFMDIDKVVKYIKLHTKVKIYVDNHADFSNSATNWLSRNILHKFLWRHCANLIEPYTTKFYGVLPARVDFLEQIYKIPPPKCELLVMGADDEKVEESKQPHVKKEIRNQYDIKDSDFLIMTGGKIDSWKTQTLLLMEAVGKIKNANVKLIVFGSVVPDLKDKLIKLCIPNKVIYVGWIPSEDSYKYFASADLVVFPGRHSVFWEQVVGQGIPMVCKYWKGTTHIDVGGNVIFLREDTADEILTILQNLLKDPEQYQNMLNVSQTRGKQKFSYADIAKRSIEKV